MLYEVEGVAISSYMTVLGTDSTSVSDAFN